MEEMRETVAALEKRRLQRRGRGGSEWHWTEAEWPWLQRRVVLPFGHDGQKGEEEAEGQGGRVDDWSWRRRGNHSGWLAMGKRTPMAATEVTTVDERRSRGEEEKGGSSSKEEPAATPKLGDLVTATEGSDSGSDALEARKKRERGNGGRSAASSFVIGSPLRRSESERAEERGEAEREKKGKRERAPGGGNKNKIWNLLDNEFLI